MKNYKSVLLLLGLALAFSCSDNSLDKKGFPLTQPTEDRDDKIPDGIARDSVALQTRPSSVLLTSFPNVRLTTIYKVNYSKKKKHIFIGSNRFHYSYNSQGRSPGNNWHNNLMPGLEAAYGYNMVNISAYNLNDSTQKMLFQKPVLIRTLYYPSYSKDTLNHQAVKRDYILVSVYNEDTNGDHYINMNDLRRFCLFDMNGKKLKALIPENYSVYKSEYDPENDFMYVFAIQDENENGTAEGNETRHVFWIDLKDPTRTGREY